MIRQCNSAHNCVCGGAGRALIPALGQPSLSPKARQTLSDVWDYTTEEVFISVRIPKR